MERLDVGDARLEARRLAGTRPGPTLVLLHEGLGCVALWRDFPEKLAAATGLPVFVYSRAGYGGSTPVPLPRPLDYLQREGEHVVSRVLDAAGIDDAVLVGHSDGGSIALVHAATHAGARVRSLVLMAPHVVCEDVSVLSIARAREAYERGELRVRLAKYHGANVDVAFRGWNDAWLDPGFRAFDLRPYLPRLTVPVLLVQGRDDEYGTALQLRLIEAGLGGPCETHELDACGHAPWRDQPIEVLRLVRDFVRAP